MNIYINETEFKEENKSKTLIIGKNMPKDTQLFIRKEFKSIREMWINSNIIMEYYLINCK